MPNVDKECVTHHYACPCREKVLQDYIRATEAYIYANNTCNMEIVIRKYTTAWEALKKLKHD